MRKQLTIGSRGSPLALWQAEWARRTLAESEPALDVRIEVIKTRGDRILNAPFSQIGGKGLFTKEIEDALLEGRIDMAVHSLKDLPTELPPGLTIGAFSPRADARDAFIGRGGIVFDDVPRGGKIGTSSLRRQAALLSMRPDLDLVAIRGNVDTRIRKVESENLHGTVLAAAGLERLGRQSCVTDYFPADRVLPAPGQGVVAVEVREADAEVAGIVTCLNDATSALAVVAERCLLASLGGGCRVPIGAWARLEGERLVLDGLVALPDASRVLRSRAEAVLGEAAEALGERVAQDLTSKGAAKVLDSLK